MKTSRRPRLAVWKLASCDGCQLTVLNCEDELLELAEVFEIGHFAEATSTSMGGRFDISLVEGSVSTSHDLKLVQEIRRRSQVVVAIGACATGGGVQGLRNGGDLAVAMGRVYPIPAWVASLPNSTPVKNHILVDFELRGCPIPRDGLLDLLSSLLSGRAPRSTSHSVCEECKRAGTVCLLVAGGQPCLGPITHAGCGALCPGMGRPCYGCFGPSEAPNARSLLSHLHAMGVPRDRCRALLQKTDSDGFESGDRGRDA